VVFSFVMSGTWASYTIDLDGTSVDFSYTQEEMILGPGSESQKFSYDLGEDSDQEMGEAIGQSVSIGTIAIWMLMFGLIWRLAVSIGGAQKIPALCQHHRIIDTLLMTGGSLLAFVSLLYFIIKSPSSAELFSYVPEQIMAISSIDGGTSFTILALMVIFVPYTIAVFTFGEYGAPVRNFLRSFDIPIPGEEEDVATTSSSGERTGVIGTLLQNPFDNPRISGMPWLTIGIAILVLFALGGGGFLLYNMVLSSGESESESRNTYQLETSNNNIQSEETVYANDQSTTWSLLTNEPMDGSISKIELYFQYDETGISDGLWDELEVELIDAPLGFDISNSTYYGSSNDGALIFLELHVDRGREVQDLGGEIISLSDDERTELLSYYNEHGFGVGEWVFSITINDSNSLIENGEDVHITIIVKERELSTMDPE
ncbi:MAG: hypothetical protein VX473_01520, partial [Candidatus Thermoplasmatota archaeon]|nr:hypothetical protein [Candidatus Thermoplasmatota archaeon]